MKIDVEGSLSMDIKNLKDTIKRIKQEAVDALTTDGAHHKQYSLECILNWSCETEEEFEKLREEYEWNEGLPA